MLQDYSEDVHSNTNFLRLGHKTCINTIKERIIESYDRYPSLKLILYNLDYIEYMNDAIKKAETELELKLATKRYLYRTKKDGIKLRLVTIFEVILPESKYWKEIEFMFNLHK